MYVRYRHCRWMVSLAGMLVCVPVCHEFRCHLVTCLSLSVWLVATRQGVCPISVSDIIGEVGLIPQVGLGDISPRDQDIWSLNTVTN